MATRPDSTVLTDDNHDPVEVLDLGDVLVLFQRDEKGETQTITLGPKQLEALKALHLVDLEL